MFLVKLLILCSGTAGILWISRASLRKPFHHGFFRLFAWEFILILFVINMNYWFVDLLSMTQIISWVLLFISLVFIILGVKTFRSLGKSDPLRDDPSLVGIEKTTRLITSGVYQYVRHPFYSSLLFLAWGILFKRITWAGILLIALVTAFLIYTAKTEEIENIQYFGEGYLKYMTGTKMFIPYLL